MAAGALGGAGRYLVAGRWPNCASGSGSDAQESVQGWWLVGKAPRLWLLPGEFGPDQANSRD
jgi:hypothetical protein